MATIRRTLLPDFKEITDSYRRDFGIQTYPEININRDNQIYMINGCEFGFYGLDDPKKVHGMKQDIAWLNEVMEINRASFDQIDMRTTRFLILDYNPSDEDHWVFDLDKRSDVITIKSTVLDNPFVEEPIRTKILGYQPTPENLLAGTADNYMWEVYGLGNKAKLEGAIYTNWGIVDEIPANARPLGKGLDFGFTNDPTALSDVFMYDNSLYIDELIYERGLTNEDIALRMTSLGIRSEDLIVADSSEPKSIEELTRLGFRNIYGAVKGADSVRFGIDLLRGYRIYITKRSANIEKELRKYKWRQNQNGEFGKNPVDAFNHALDGVRYLATDVLANSQEVIVYDSNMYF